MADQEEPHGPDGFPLCSCGAQRRVSSAMHPGLCAECISKLSQEERDAAARKFADTQENVAE